MSVADAVSKRVSTRAFKNTPIPEQELQSLFNDAQLAPSNCNVQPWQVYVVSGEKKDALKNALIQEVMKTQTPKPDFDWTIRYEGVHLPIHCIRQWALHETTNPLAKWQ